MGHDEPVKASSCAAAPHQVALTGNASESSPEEVLAGALRAFRQGGPDFAAQQASRSPSPCLQSPADSGSNLNQEQQQPQQMLQQASSLPDLSKGAAAEQSPSPEQPTQAVSEPGPSQERQNSAVLRPTPQRIGLGDVNTGSLPLSPTTSLRPSGSLKNLGSLASPGAQPTDQAGTSPGDAAAMPSSPSWQPQGSAWKRYVAQATDAANPFRGFGAASPGQAQPAASAAPAAPEGPAGPAAAASAPVQSAPAGPFPAQLSLEKLQAERRSSLQQIPDGAGQAGRDLQTLQAAASALFRQMIKADPAQQHDDEQPLLQHQSSAPEGFGSRIPSMASNFQEAATSFLEAARANAIAQSPASSPAQALQAQHTQLAQQAQQAWQSKPYLQLLQSMDSRQLQSLSTISASPPPSSAERYTDSDRAPSSGNIQKKWADAATALLGPVAPRQQLSSAFSDALASRAGRLSPLALPMDTSQPIASVPLPKKNSADAAIAAAPREDWSTACFSIFKDSACHYSLPLSGWQVPGGEGQNKSVSMPISAPGDPNLLKMHGNLLAGIGNMGSLVMPGTPSLPNLPTKASVSPPLSPQDSMTPLGRQLEMCLARQVQVQNAKRHGPLQVLMSEEQMAAAAAAAAGGNPQRFSAIPWPHNSQQSLDSQVSRIQLAQVALEKADMFKVPGNLASFLKQASLDTAMALLQQREATPLTPVARQLAGQGGGAVWPFGAMSPPAMSPPGPSPDHRLSSLNLQSSPHRGIPVLQGGMHGGEPHRLQASQQVFQDMGNSAINPQLTEAVLADSLYRSVTERLQSGAGPASFNQGGLNYGAAEDATFYRMDSGAAHGGAPNYSNMLAGYHQQQSDPNQHMMELLGLLRAGLVTPQDHMSGGKRRRRGDSPGAWRKRRGDDMDGHMDAPPPPKRSANNKCEECGTTETPTWRRWGPTLLCNACGLRRKKNPKLQPPPKDALPAEQPTQHSWDPSAQLSSEDARSGDHSQLTHPMAPMQQ